MVSSFFSLAMDLAERRGLIVFVIRGARVDTGLIFEFLGWSRLERRDEWGCHVQRPRGLGASPLFWG